MWVIFKGELLHYTFTACDVSTGYNSLNGIKISFEILNLINFLANFICTFTLFFMKPAENSTLPTDNIEVSGAREHNLKNIDITIPKNKLVVFTGVSGSGKSSLAFDTIYNEGQRRYMESFSAYARDRKSVV